MGRIIVLDDAHPVLCEKLREAGHEVLEEPKMAYEELLSAVADYEGLVVRSRVAVDRAVIDAGARLRCIGRVGAGMETIDVKYAESKGIRCLNSPEGNRDAVGEHAVGLLLALFDNIAAADREVREGQWRREANRGMEVKDHTIGIIGYGNMGTAFAKRLRGFECQVLAYDKYKHGFGDETVREATLEELMEEADVVSLHVPLTEETRHMVDEKFIEKFAKSISLINTSRGAVVDTAALVEQMKKGKVTGAALDVIEYEDMAKDGIRATGEPEPLAWLKQSRKTVLTPHVAGWTVESKYKLAAVLADKINEVLCS